MNKDRIKFAAVIVLQIAFLLFLIFSKQSALASGTKILLKTAPVDPRSLFSGDYVTLGYDISEIDLTKVNTDIDYKSYDPMKSRFKDSKKYVYIKLSKKNENKFWTPDSVTFAKPDIKDNEVFIKSRKWYLDPYSRSIIEFDEKRDQTINKYIHITYDFSSFYVPEGMGLEIERKVRDTDKNEILVEVSVGKNGYAMLSKLLINGIPISF